MSLLASISQHPRLAAAVLGHLRIVPSHSPEHAYQQWSKEYGSDVLHFNILGQSVIVLNSVNGIDASDF